MNRIIGIVSGAVLIGLTFLIVVLLNTVAYGAVNPNLSEAEKLRRLFTDPTCVHACYLGIEPGRTTREETEALLTKHGIVYEKDWNQDYSWHDESFPFRDPWPRLWVNFNHEKNSVWQIWPPLRVSKSLVIEAFGMPDHVIVIEEPFKHEMSTYDFVYLAKGILLSFDIDDDMTFLTRLIVANHPYWTLAGENGNLADKPCETYGTAPCLVPTSTVSVYVTPTSVP